VFSLELELLSHVYASLQLTDLICNFLHDGAFIQQRTYLNEQAELANNHRKHLKWLLLFKQ
jgi:hypothetical protein